MTLCLLEHRILHAAEECTTQTKCCDSCAEEEESGHDEDRPCCLEIEKLSDSNLPSGPERVPAFDAVELPLQSFLALVHPVEWNAVPSELPAENPLRPPPSSRRALLSIWTI